MNQPQDQYRTTEDGVYGFPWRPADPEDLFGFMGTWCTQCTKYGTKDSPSNCSILQSAILGEYGELAHNADGHLQCPGYESTC